MNKAIPGGVTGKNSAYLFKTEAGDRPLREIEAEANASPYGAYGAEDDVSRRDAAAQPHTGTSIFDPVLCELAYRWFCPPGGAILDPFAGGSVRGIVAAKLGRNYTGVDLRYEQIAANDEQAMRIVPGNPPRWIVGDSRDIGTLAPGAYDFVFSCPPYADLEVYSDDPADLSTMEYDDFLEAYRAIIAASVAMLKPDRFACFVVGDVRGKDGIYRKFPWHTVQAFEDAGALLHNEAVLITAVGSLPIRAGKQFSSGRKLGKTHQNVLVFVKGDPKKATDSVGEVAFGEAGDPDGGQMDPLLNHGDD